MRRRTFLHRLVYAAGIGVFAALPFGLGRLLVPDVRAERSKHLRPPGALADDEAFNRACIGCGMCGEICPPRCIQFYQRDGGDFSNTPYIDPEVKACILCMKCIDVCPTESLTEIGIRDVKMGYAQIDRAACYPWVDKGVCGACVSICPLGEQAINFEFGNFYRPVVQKGCVGCGLCVEVCPEPSLPIAIVDRSKGTVTPHTISG